MKTIEVSVGYPELQALLRQAREEALLLTRRGQLVAAVVPMKGVDAETLSLSANPEFLTILRNSFAELDSAKTVSLSQMRRRTGDLRSARNRRRTNTRST